MATGTEDNLARRLELLRRMMEQQGIDALLVTKRENRRYLSGFTGSNGVLLVAPDDAYILTDGRYGTQASLEAPSWKPLLFQNSLTEALAGLCREHDLQRLGFEQDNLTYQRHGQLSARLAETKLYPTAGLIEQLRLIKDVDEIKLIQEAGIITGAAFWYLLGHMRCGQTEQEIAGCLESFMRNRGGCKPAFETIVAAGERGALPHGVASEKDIQSGQLVVMDFGARYHGYMSDFTRTVCIGRFEARQRQVYEVVLEAQQCALNVIRAGVTAAQVDAAARRVIAASGYGEYFPHALGHGLGLNIHEEPRLAPRYDTILKAGMVTTVEPGIYLPGWGGVRIEDTVLVTETGCEILTPVTKDFLVI